MKGRKAEIRAVNGALTKAPPAPAWLPQHAKDEWRRIMPGLIENGRIARHELSTVEDYCLCVARKREAEVVLQNDGLTYVSPTGELKRRPETTILKEAIEASRRLAAELGLTPASREKNKGGAAIEDENDALASI
ncbi:phage terminase small subunit P27 family [Agrobacterium radiobacter]|jgi:P27 family predicted phage terminase small subunit|uniref:phage terminase small subunit P27 family n=1 Tax=Agrobacterium tumefaciens complex TaxID=1183400 RepID=UPI0009BC575C|nr:phage terminase small subunit P27 family [Agrobacterium tumefaciens]MCW8057659.1 phage terminase small subunit P27 family [Agrobacterium tumefaciens]MCW8146939.1 phage terminase small subunit P27 family [Agrobacterium tumefaciens]UXT21800.1 phage terminase small subunit P27 family [Agrobacterium tumefaciens]UXT96529.1 phage terminase small subunit P27 family [Agrobacterium tumefaciens]CUW87498.1 Phage terminase, small subunit, P27 family [Agrobacterium fabacearum S56]